MPVSRRTLINTGAASGAGLLATGLATGSLATPAAAATTPGARTGSSSSPLFPPLQSSPGDLLALPRGFSYEVVAVSGRTEVHDGTGKAVGVTPERPDGTLVVTTDRGRRLVQNHEASPGSPQPVPLVEGTVYDRGALGGGCTVIDTNRRGVRRSEWVGLSGTVSNCAGGPTPWGSWLTCEESENKAGTGTLQQDHGFVFEVFADQPAAQVPKPIKAWGRFPHEAVVIEPDRRTAYLTEDASKPTGLLYRWTAPTGYKLRPRIAEHLKDDDGTLSALAVVAPDGGILPDLAYLTSAQIGRPLQTRWVKVPDRHARTTSTRKQFADGTVTRSKKLEGAWGDRRGMYFVSSFAFDGPDGCHVSPYGSLVLSEDGNTAQHLLSWTRETGAQAIARNLIVLEKNSSGADVYSEMTGPCFSPDGLVLFGNVQEPGHVFAINGPWRTYLG